MKGRMPLLIAAAAAFTLCLSLPVIVVEQITGLWGILERATDDYLKLLASSPTAVSIYEWAQSYPNQGNLNFSVATWLFLLLVPGPLTLGLSTVFLRVLRGQDTYADMVFSGFGNFVRAMFLNLIRTVFIALWSILFVIPGIIAYYRYNIAFFLLADNPEMSPFTAISLSKYYMRENKGNRFVLDLTFIGWFIVASIAMSLISGMVADIIDASGTTVTFFISQLITCIVGAVVMAPVFAYRGIAAAEYYHRVICRDPASFKDPLKLPDA